jgi:hypothetical protein
VSRASIGASVALALLGAASRASAQSGPPVQVVIDACVPVDRADVLRLARIELGLGTGGAFVGPGTTVVMVGCAGNALSILVDDPVTGKQTERAVRLSGADTRARARLLALAIAELVTTSWSEVAVNPRPALAPVRPPPAAPVRAAVVRAVRRRVPALQRESPWALALGLFASERTLSTSAGMVALWGGGARASFALSRSVGAEANVAIEGTVVDVPQGGVSVALATAGLLLLWRHHGPAWTFRAGSGVRGGVMVLEGLSLDTTRSPGASFAAPWGALVLAAGASVRVTGRWSIDLACEAGTAVLPVRALAGDQALLSLGGPWVGVSIGVGQRP